MVVLRVHFLLVYSINMPTVNSNAGAYFLERRAHWENLAAEGKNFDCVPVKQPTGPDRKFTYKSLAKDAYGQRQCIADLAQMESRAKYPTVGGKRRFRKTKSRKSRSRKTRRR